MHEQPGKNQQKIYAASSKPFGHKHLTTSILDILLDYPDTPLTISNIRRELHRRRKYYYKHDTLHNCINCIAEMRNITLTIHHLTRGTNTRVKAFTITINNRKNELFKNA